MDINPYTQNYNKIKDEKNQFNFGVALAILFSIVGLFAGFLYPTQSKERLTFIDGWKKGIIIQIVIGIIIGIICIACLSPNSN